MTSENTRTIKQMKPAAQSKARSLWDQFTNEPLEFSDYDKFCQLRDEYHAMFKDSNNFQRA